MAVVMATVALRQQEEAFAVDVPPALTVELLERWTVQVALLAMVSALYMLRRVA
jgi:hypothetical protein